MGACVSTPDACVSTPGACVGVKKRAPRSSRRRRRKQSRFRDVGSSPASVPNTNPAVRESHEEAWFDSSAIFDSDYDEDCRNVPEDLPSSSGVEGERASLSRHSSFQDAKFSTPRSSFTNQTPKQGDSSTLSFGHGSFFDGLKSPAARVSHSDDADAQSKSSNEARQLVVSSNPTTGVGGSHDREDAGLLDGCGILPHNCLPCLASVVPSIEKRKPISLSSQSFGKKTFTKVLSKSKDGHAATVSSKIVLQRPPAGRQVPFCPVDNKLFDCWSPVDPGTFRVRGPNYLRDKKKDFAANHAAYYPIGVDVFLSPRKINHIARFVELPTVDSSAVLPPILIVNVQVPLYPASIFQTETDGEGMSVVLYFKISDNYSNEMAPHFQECFKRLINDEVEKVKGFAMDSVVPFRERLKILGRVANVEELQLGAAERTLLNAYNEKPVLSRPQHEFYSGDNYFEIDVDMHRFKLFSRKGFSAFQDRLKSCILDVGLTIQGNKPEELPEQILCCVSLKGLDHVNYNQLGTDLEIMKAL